MNDLVFDILEIITACGDKDYEVKFRLHQLFEIERDYALRKGFRYRKRLLNSIAIVNAEIVNRKELAPFNTMVDVYAKNTKEIILSEMSDEQKALIA